nr:hypothetical protein [Mycoplasmopsis bovis]
MAALIVAYVVIRLIDKKRLDDIGDFFGEKSVEIHWPDWNSKKQS